MERKENLTLLAQIASRKLLLTALTLLTLSIGIVIGTTISRDATAASHTEDVAPDATPLEVPQAEPLENQFTEIVRKLRPSVVNISVEQLPEEREEAAPGPTRPGQEGMEEFFRRFFNMPNGPGGEGGPGPQMPRQMPRGEGSGVVVDPAGYILTNRHVVEDADRMRVRFPDDETLYDAKVIGFDNETDLAVIKVDAKGKELTVASVGNSDAVQVGDWAVAIGSPFGFRETVTVGIISALSREVHSSRGSIPPSPFQKFFQTDAAINPGNSGGPLVNIRGELIGINTAIVSRTGSFAGLGFALPSNVAVGVFNNIIKHGRVPRGSIGISFQSGRDPALLRVYGAKDGGVLVESLTEDWPAEKAGMEIEDIIVSIEGIPVHDGEGLVSIVASKPVGSTVEIEVIRNMAGEGEDPQPKRLTLEVEIADREKLLSLERGQRRGGPPRIEREEADVDFGIKFSELTSHRSEGLDYDGDEGVIITEVEPASFAEDIGLLPNDIIVSINRRPVVDVSDVGRLRAELEAGDDVAFKVMRRSPGGWTPQYLAGVVPDE